MNVEEIRKLEEQKEEARLQIVLAHMEAGVSFVDWKNVYIDAEVQIGAGTKIGFGVSLEGKTNIGTNCMIGNHSRILDSTIDDEAEVQFSVITKSKVGARTKVGPFAYLRPDSFIGKDAKVGDFVEVKNSTIGDGAKASHLTYIGDSDVGDRVNLGCGVVFVNYNGSSKSRSIVEEDAFIGCNSNLVSPVCVGKGAYVAAGTTITEDVPAGALCIGRSRSVIQKGWVAKRGILKKKDK